MSLFFGRFHKRFGALGLIILTVALYSSIAFATAPSVTINQPLSGYYNGLLRIDFNWADSNELETSVDVNLFIFTAGASPDANFLYDANIMDKNLLGTATNAYTSSTIISGGCIDHDSNIASSNR